MRQLSDEVQKVLGGIKGVGEVTGEQLTGQPVLQVRMDPQAIARYGVPTRNVLNVVEAVGTKKVGEVREGQRRFPLVVRLPDRQRTDPDALANTLIPTATGSVLPLNQVAQVVETEGPATINREWGKRRITVQCNVRGRDVGSFVAEAQKKIAEQVKLPEGYSIEWGGQFENMERANAAAAVRRADGARADLRPALLQPRNRCATSSSSPPAFRWARWAACWRCGCAGCPSPSARRSDSSP